MARTMDLVRDEIAKYPAGAQASRIALCIGRDVTVVRATITRLLREGSIIRAKLQKVKKGSKGNTVATYVSVAPEMRDEIMMNRVEACFMPSETPHCASMLARLMGALRYDDHADSIGKGGGRNFLRAFPAPSMERGEAMGPWQ